MVDVASARPLRIRSGQPQFLPQHDPPRLAVFSHWSFLHLAPRDRHSLEVNLCGTLVHLIRNTSRQPAQPHCFSPVSFSEALCPIQNNLPSGGPIHIAEGPRFRLRASICCAFKPTRHHLRTSHSRFIRLIICDPQTNSKLPNYWPEPISSPLWLSGVPPSVSGRPVRRPRSSIQRCR